MQQKSSSRILHVAPLHAGADAKVFLAYHRQTLEQVAVKIISKCFTKMVPADSIHTDLCTAKVAGVSIRV